MRFVRVFTRADTGEIIAVGESEAPIEHMAVTKIVPNDGGAEIPVQMHELGLAEDFEPVDLDGKPCSPSWHLFQRLARADVAEAAAARFVPKAGATLPRLHDCPTSLEGMRERLRERGPEGIPAKARAWLTLMLPPDTAAALGIRRGIPIGLLRALDAQRTRRDPEAGSRMAVLEREAQRRSDERARSHLRARQREAARDQERADAARPSVQPVAPMPALRQEKTDANALPRQDQPRGG